MGIMNDIFSKLIQNFKKEEPQKNETIIKFPTETENRAIKSQRAIQINHSLEIQKIDRLKNQEDERKEILKEKKQQNELSLQYISEFERIYKRSDVIESINDRQAELKVNSADIFLLYLFHFKGIEKLEDSSYINLLSDFILEKFQLSYSPANIQETAKEKFLLFKNVEIGNNIQSQLVYLSFFNNICITINLHTGTTELDLWSLDSFSNYSIEEQESSTYKVVYPSSFYIHLNQKDKNSFIDYFIKANERTLKEIELNFKDTQSTIKHLQEVREQLDSDVKNMIYNFVMEIPEEFMLSPYLYSYLEYYIAEYRFAENMIESTLDNRNTEVSWWPLEGPNTSEAAKTLKNDYFDKLNSILKSKIEIEEELVPALVWLEFREQARNYYSSKWIEDYGVYFPSSELDMDNILFTYCKINEIDSLDTKNISYLTYYLMNLGFFDGNTHFLANHKKISGELEEIKKQMDLTAFEQKLMKTPTAKNRKISFDDLDMMTGNEFEYAIAELFKKMGYFAVVTKASGDQGIDVIAEKEGRKFGIQTKCYGSKVTNTAVQETAAGIVYYECDRGIVITNNHFTPSAIQLAAKNNIILWDREMLKEKFKEFMEH